MKWLLDTNVVSEGIRPHPDHAVLSWIAARSPELLAVSTVTVAELRYGISINSDPDERSRLSRWVDIEVAKFFRGRTLSITVEILTDWLALSDRLGRKGRPRSAPDLLIAATARVHDLILVSRNSRDFIGTGVMLFDPWTGKINQMDAL